MVWNFLFASIPTDVCIGSPGGGIGRRAGLKILYAAMRVRVQFPSGAQVTADSRESAFLFILTILQHFTG